MPPAAVSRNYLQESQLLAEEFCNNTSIHGVKYFVGSKRALIEKIWWIAVFLLSLYGCGRLIYTVYRKWEHEPVIVTFAQRPTPVFQIPFPAITICPDTRAKVEEFNFTKVYHLSVDSETRKTISARDMRKLQAMLQICEFGFNGLLFNETYDNDCAKILKSISIPQEQLFVYCEWHQLNINCTEDFTLVLTDVGYCYSYNLLASGDILREDQLHPDSEYIAETRSSYNWTLDNGYRPRTDINTYPRRALGAGIKAGVFALLSVNEDDMDYLCSNSFQGFKVLLHMPNEYPQLLNQHFRVPLNQEVAVSVTPTMIETSDSIKSYTPSRRQCFFGNERYLKYFRAYTQSNCELECLTNFTLKKCGCVQLSMPRAPNVSICGIGQQECYNRATSELLEMEVKLLEKSQSKQMDECNCLPSCRVVQYNTEISQASFEWQKLLSVFDLTEGMLTGFQVSHLQVFLKEGQFIPIQRNELFGLTDFLANCGGLLGLFMGVSILSLVEIFYYCAIKPLVMWMKSKTGRNQTEYIQPIRSDLNGFGTKQLNILRYDNQAGIGKF
ncbi:pickpocket protein 28-like [Malaya genurostris]|uniref:pickpocket protein 28-like n=1 Tax=Malaya genurostris TaxID=325434 RepID=UPI0026F3C40E|nr:pickpocket protein 28-like [Malaya genurostris]